MFKGNFGPSVVYGCDSGYHLGSGQFFCGGCANDEASTKVIGDKGVSAEHVLLPSAFPDGPTLLFLTNFSHQTQWINEGTVLERVVPVYLVDYLPDSSAATSELDFQKSVNPDLPQHQRDLVVGLLRLYVDCFAVSRDETGKSNLVQHTIDTGGCAPIHQAPYSSAWQAREVIQQQVQEMLEVGVVETSNSPWASPVVLTKKRDGSWRFCIDYRRLNSVTVKDAYPLPRIQDALSRLEGSNFFSIIDMQSSYWQIEMAPEDRRNTAFVTADGLYQFRVMPFGLTKAPSTFQRMMDVMLAGLKLNV